MRPRIDTDAEFQFLYLGGQSEIDYNLIDHKIVDAKAILLP